MTLAEKLAQLGSLWSFELFRGETGSTRRGCAARLARRHRPGQPRGRGDEPRPVEAAEAGNAIQRFLVEETRLGIPAIVHEETPPRAARPRRAVLPAVDRRGAPRSTRTLVEAMAATIRRRMLRDRRPPGAGARSSTSRATRAGAGSRRPTARTPTSRRCSAGLRARHPGRRPRERRRRDRQAHGRPRPGRGRAQPGARPHRARASCATSSCSRSRPRSATAGIGVDHARLLRRRRRAVPRVARAADDDPARRVGVRRHRRLGLHRRRDAASASTG